MAIVLETSLPDMVYRGKVRDTYDLVDGLMLMVATDRISAFDVVLPTGIPRKGLVLSRMAAFWFGITDHLIANHLIALGDQSDVVPVDSPVGPVPSDILR